MTSGASSTRTASWSGCGERSTRYVATVMTPCPETLSGGHFNSAEAAAIKNHLAIQETPTEGEPVAWMTRPGVGGEG